MPPHSHLRLDSTPHTFSIAILPSELFSPGRPGASGGGEDRGGGRRHRGDGPRRLEAAQKGTRSLAPSLHPQVSLKGRLSGH